MKCPDCGTSVALSKSIDKQSGEQAECPKCETQFDPPTGNRRLRK